MIIRQWHGWTASANADAYEALFRSSGPNTSDVEGRLGAFLLRRDTGDESKRQPIPAFRGFDVAAETVAADYEAGRGDDGRAVIRGA